MGVKLTTPFDLASTELATAVQEKVDLTIVLMNDKGYGVIKNIQDVQYGGRRVYADLHTPDYTKLAEALQFRHQRIDSLAQAQGQLAELAGHEGPSMLEVDMLSVGSFKTAFAGPPVKAAK